MLAYYVERHIRRVLVRCSSITTTRTQPGCNGKVSWHWQSVLRRPKRKLAAKYVKTKHRAQFHTLPSDLATIVKNTVKMKNGTTSESFEKIMQPIGLQQRALELLGVKLLFVASANLLDR